MKIWIFVIKFLFLGALFILSNENLHVGVHEERAQFYGLFEEWLGTLYSHSGQIIGYVVDSEWLPEQNSAGPLEGT